MVTAQEESRQSLIAYKCEVNPTVIIELSNSTQQVSVMALLYCNETPSETIEC